MRPAKRTVRRGLAALAIIMTACSDRNDEAPPPSAEEAGLPTAWLAERGLPFARPEDVGMSSARLREIDAIMQSYVQKEWIQGGVTAIARKGKVVHFAAHGTVSWTDPANEISAVLMVQQPTKGLTADFEEVIRDAILE